MTDETASRAFRQGDRVVQSDHRPAARGASRPASHAATRKGGTGRLCRVSVGPDLPMMRSDRESSHRPGVRGGRGFLRYPGWKSSISGGRCSRKASGEKSGERRAAGTWSCAARRLASSESRSVTTVERLPSIPTLRDLVSRSRRSRVSRSSLSPAMPLVAPSFLLRADVQ
jgi:hypothetical protein